MWSAFVVAPFGIQCFGMLGFHRVLIRSFPLFCTDISFQGDLPPIQIRRCHQLFCKSKSCQSLIPFYLLWEAAYSHTTKNCLPQQIHRWAPPWKLEQGPGLVLFRYSTCEGFLTFNTRFTYLKVFDVARGFDSAQWHSSVMESQCKHNKIIVISSGITNHMWFLSPSSTHSPSLRATVEYPSHGADRVFFPLYNGCEGMTQIS